ncbi:MarR family winged helix-turn-helix transcriptional regulator [Agrobacterium bohemicum]|uniref:MarR family transcriptional regulator n=1 Tax=Agrobacterium bohemicum TaxID=2052828 RepID=A0A135P917_9HYPH|nr:MarR family winged helix-turn-helix transcriptional regulator [Agrobacterium bohemicum]KXG87929.1 MarR family transcriptional regulator [Agrobacterium bohemicum]
MSRKTFQPDLPQPGDGKRGSDGYLGYLLRQAAHAYRVQAEQALADVALTLPQFSVLTMLASYPGHSNADLARLALLTPQTMSVIVANLLKAGLVVRQDHAVHGRIRHIVLTENGLTVLTLAKQRVYAIENDMLEGLSDAEEQTVRDWLVRTAKG